MPTFPKPDNILTREQSINAILTSIAVEETAIGHVIEAESEKIRYAIDCAKVKGCNCTDMQKIIEVNQSVTNLIEKATVMQVVLKDKLSAVLKYLPPHPHPPKPPCPPVPPHPPKPPCPPVPPPVPPCHCTSVFTTVEENDWFCDTTLRLKETKCCKNGVKHVRKNCESLILLPSCKKYKIDFEIDMINKNAGSIEIEMEFRRGGDIVHKEIISKKNARCFVQISHSLGYKTSCDAKEHAIAIRLITPKKLRVIRGKVMVTAI